MLLKAIVFDWAGTLIDPGCQAPVDAYLSVFNDLGLPLEERAARKGMGLPKLDHIRQMLALPEIAAAFHQRHGEAPTETHEQDIYARVTSAMRVAAAQNSAAVPGAADALAALRRHGIRIAATTGYPRAVMDVILPLARRQGIDPDFTICSDEADNPRPGPGQVLACLTRLGAPLPHLCLKVDDTPAGLAEGKAAGLLTLGVTDTGSTRSFDSSTLAPDFLLPSVASIPAQLANIERLVASFSQGKT